MSCSRALVVCVVRCVLALVEIFPSWYSFTSWVGMGSMKGGWLLVVGFELVCLSSRCFCRRFGVGLRFEPYDLHIPWCMWLCLCCVSYNVVVCVIIGGANGLCGFWLG